VALAPCSAPLFDDTSNFIWLSAAIEHCHNNRSIGLHDKIDDIVGALEYRAPDRAVLLRKPFRVPGNPPCRLVIHLANMLSAIGSPRRIVRYRSAKITFDLRQRNYRKTSHALRSRRINSSWEMGLLLPERYAARRSSRTFLCRSGTGIFCSSATESQRLSAISSRLRLGRRRRDETDSGGMMRL